MALKVAIFAMACLLLVTARVSSNAEESFMGEEALAHAPVASPAPAPAPHIFVKDIKECGGLCKGRCSLHSRPNNCNRVCNTCCFRCKCVPPGTSGNRGMCGKCYTDMTTHGNRTKCP